MADVKISQLPVSADITGDEIIPIVQGGITKQSGVKIAGGIAAHDDAVKFDGIEDAVVLDKHEIYLVESSNSIYADIEKDGGGDLRVQFNGVIYNFDCTTGAGVNGRARIQLVSGVSSSFPIKNYVYIELSFGSPVLAISTTRPPNTGVAVLAYVLIPDAITFVNEGPYVFQRYTNSIVNFNIGQIPRIMDRIRRHGATYDSGINVAVPITSNPSSPDNVNITTTLGKVLQFHEQTFPAKSASVNGIFVANDPVQKYKKITDLNQVLYDANNVSASGKRLNYILWGSVNKNTSDCKLFLNLPSSSYTNDALAINDSDNTAFSSFPSDFRQTGFLIARITIKHTVQASGTWVVLAINDLRGAVPGNFLGATAITQIFDDDVFRLTDNLDPSRNLAFQLDNISTGQTRTVTIPDKDGILTMDSDYVRYNTKLSITGALPYGGQYSVISSGTNYTKSGDNGDLKTSDALFLTAHFIKIRLNGILQEKGNDVLWINQNTFQLQAAVDNGDILTIET